MEDEFNLVLAALSACLRTMSLFLVCNGVDLVLLIANTGANGNNKTLLCATAFNFDLVSPVTI